MPGGLRRCGKVFPSSPSSLLGLIQVRSDHPWQLRFAQGRQQSPESTNDAWCNPTPSTTLLRMLMDDSSEQGFLQPLFVQGCILCCKATWTMWSSEENVAFVRACKLRGRNYICPVKGQSKPPRRAFGSTAKDG